MGGAVCQVVTDPYSAPSQSLCVTFAIVCMYSPDQGGTCISMKYEDTVKFKVDAVNVNVNIWWRC